MLTRKKKFWGFFFWARGVGGGGWLVKHKKNKLIQPKWRFPQFSQKEEKVFGSNTGHNLLKIISRSYMELNSATQNPKQILLGSRITDIGPNSTRLITLIWAELLLKLETAQNFPAKQESTVNRFVFFLRSKLQQVFFSLFHSMWWSDSQQAGWIHSYLKSLMMTTFGGQV